MPTPQDFQERVARIEKLVQELDSCADGRLREEARELIQALMELHGAGLERILEIVNISAGGAELIRSIGHDELLSSLLVLYGLHPEDLETRVRRGIDKVRAHIRSRGVSIEVVAIAEDNVRLEITGPSSDELVEVIRRALLETAPDAANVEIIGGERTRSAGFVPLSSLLGTHSTPALSANASRP